MDLSVCQNHTIQGIWLAALH